MEELNGEVFTVSDSNATLKSFKLKDSAGVGYIDTSLYTAYTSGGTVQEVDNSFTGLSHLNGEEARINANGDTYDTATVSGGSITLDDYYESVSVGLFDDRYIGLLPIEGSKLYGKMKQIRSVLGMFFKSVGGFVAPVNKDNEYDESRERELDWSKLKDPIEWETYLNTGTLKLDVINGPTKRVKIKIRKKNPTPFTVLRVDPEVS